MSAAIAVGPAGLLPGSKPGVHALVPGRSAGLCLHGRIAGRKIGRGGAPLTLLESKRSRSSAAGRSSSLAVRSLFGGGGKPSEDVTYILKGPRTVKLSGEPQVIGARRGPQVDVVVPVTGVSGVHCKIEPVRGGVRVTDLGSTNGTTINGREIKSSVLKPGQSLGLGTGEFELVEQKAPTPAAAAVKNGAAPSRRAKPAPAVKTKVVSAGKEGRYKTVVVKASQKEQAKKPTKESSGGGLLANVFGAKKEKEQTPTKQAPAKAPAKAAKKPTEKPKAQAKRKSTPPPKSLKEAAAEKSAPPASNGETTPWGALAVGTAFAGIIADAFTSGSTAISAGGVLAAFVIAALGSTPSGTTKAKEGKSAESSSKMAAKESQSPSKPSKPAATAAVAPSPPSAPEEPKASKSLSGAAAPPASANEVVEKAVQSPPAAAAAAPAPSLAKEEVEKAVQSPPAAAAAAAAPAPSPAKEEVEKPTSAVPRATISPAADDSAAKSGVEAIEALAAEVEAAAAAKASEAAEAMASEAKEAEAEAAEVKAAAEAAEAEAAKLASKETESLPAAEGAAYRRVFTKESADRAAALGAAASAAAAQQLTQSAKSPAAHAEATVSRPEPGFPHSAGPLMASASSAKGRILSAGCGKVEKDAVLKAAITNAFSLIVTVLSLLGTAAAAAAGYLVFFKEMKLSLMTTSADEFLRSLFSTLPGKLCAAAAALFLMVIVIVMQKRDTTRLGWSA